MTTTTKPGFLFILLLICLYLGAWVYQSSLLLNEDVSYLLNASRLLVAGGNYTQDFFTPNPPMIMLLYTPALLLAKLFGGNLILAFRLYLFILISLSLWLCSSLLRNPVLILVLALLFFIVPVFEFGQREHLLLILTFPYVCLVAARLEGRKPCLAPLLGFLAGLGFCIKPYFGMLPLLIEAYAAFQQRSWLYWRRAEVYCLAAVAAFYLLSVYLFFPDYLFTILPFVLKHYHQSVGGFPLSMLLPPSMLGLYGLSLLFALITRQNKLWLIVFFGFFGCYLWQDSIPYYHILPPFVLALWLLALSFFSLNKILPLLCLALLALVLDAYKFYQLKLIFHFAPLSLSFYAAALFLLLLFAQVITAARRPFWLATATAFLLFFFPFTVVQMYYFKGEIYKEGLFRALLAFMQTQSPHASLAFYSYRSNIGLPLIEYTHSRLAQRFDCYWPVKAFATHPAQADEGKFMNFVAEDLRKDKPALVFVDRLDPSMLVVDENGGNGQFFDYLAYFSSNPSFQKEWKSYRYLTTVVQKPDYRFDVYRRVPTS